MKFRLELSVAIALTVLIVVGVWHDQRWRRTPLGRATVALARAKRRRLTRPEPEQHLTGREWALLITVALLYFAWGAAPMVAELVGAMRR